VYRGRNATGTGIMGERLSLARTILKIVLLPFPLLRPVVLNEGSLATEATTILVPSLLRDRAKRFPRRLDTSNARQGRGFAELAQIHFQAMRCRRNRRTIKGVGSRFTGASHRLVGAWQANPPAVTLIRRVMPPSVPKASRLSIKRLRTAIQRFRGEEGDRSMFSDDVVLGKGADWPKNGPVPARPVNGYPTPWKGIGCCGTAACARPRRTPWPAAGGSRRL